MPLHWTTRAEYNAVARTPFAVLRIKAINGASLADLRYAVRVEALDGALLAACKVVGMGAAKEAARERYAWALREEWLRITG
mgnify:CR=1 FL=1